MELTDMTANAVEKLTDWANEPDLLTLKGDLDAAKPYQQTQVTKIKKWQDLMNIEGKAKPQKIKGRSSVQPKLIRRQAEWRYSALSEPFLSSDKLFNVYPVTFEDQDAAKQNELLLNWQFRTKLNRIKFIDDYVRTVVDEGTAVIRVGWRRETETAFEEVPVWSYVLDNDPMAQQQQAQLLMQVLPLQHTNPRGWNELQPDIKAAAEYFQQSGQPVRAVAAGSEQVEVEKVLINEPTLDILSYQNIYFDPSCQGDVDKANFAVVSFETSKAELLKDGRYKNLDAVLWDSTSVLSQPDHDSSTPDSFNFKDTPRRRVVAYEYWGWYDVEGDGKLKPIVATWIGNVLIRMEENPFPDQKLPFIVVNYLPVKRSLYGEADAELLEEHQNILGAVTRGTIDLMARSANSQTGIAKGMLDVTNRRRFDNGQDYEFNQGIDPRMGVVHHTYPEIPQSAITIMQLQNQEAESLTGVKAFAGGISGSAYGDVAAGIRGALDASSKREMAILRRLAKGMKDIGAKLIAMNYAFLSDKEVIRVTNRDFVPVEREDLKGQFDLEVDISTAEIDNAKAQDLGFMLQTIGPNMDASITNMILGEIADLKRMPALAENIRNFKPEPDPFAEQMKQLELQKAQMEIAKLQSDIELNQAKARQTQSDADKKDLDYLEQETGTKHAREMEKDQAQAQGNQNLEVTKALLAPQDKTVPQENVERAVGYNYLNEQNNRVV
ncbi:portal protein [Erwinia phage vB_EamP-S6]|uniref:Portal protein n=1 Tax=Erwinia phage vB_EamP-S6 TaxID=1051675 RepID=G0YQI0_9CAUD|nr:portal protein [Erwinia phage vB_EamP-S6]AEJ81607.1 portal protein [Erwinia phage vB_EamP-S6]